jgi:putative DNA primase/helicase
MKNSALAMAEDGYPVFPCNAQNKQPLIKGGFKKATVDELTIQRWWDKYPNAHIGLPTGAISGLVVLDVDNKNGVSGSESLEELEELYGELPTTVCVRTRTGGYHYYFQHPDIEIKNSASKLGAGLDIRGDGGYVISPPSEGYEYIETSTYAEMPQWLIDATRKEKAKKAPKTTGLGKVGSGRRNNYLTSEAGKLRRSGKEYEEILEVITELNATKLTEPLDEAEVENIAASISTYEPEAWIEEALDNEGGLSYNFVKNQNGHLKYVHIWGKWFRWNGTVWAYDKTKSVNDAVLSMCNDLFGDDEKARKRFMTSKTVSSICTLASSHKQVAATDEDWDTNDFILNTPEGLVNLVTGKTEEHRAEELCTKVTNASPSSTACPTWKQFLKDITNNDQELIDYLQRLAGYSATGSTKEQGLYFCYGTGGNGKGTFWNTIHEILAEYSRIAPAGMFVRRNQSAHPTELANLMGARLVLAQETDQGTSWNEAKIKALTGGDVMSARFMGKNFFEFKPKFTLVIAGNHKPALRNIDEAMRRRFHMIPFTVTIPKEERDLDLPKKLLEEHDGILSWIIEGAVNWNIQGLNPPEVVLAATQDYFNDEDVFTQWINEKCEVGKDQWCAPSALFNSWRDYAYDVNIKTGTQKEFKHTLEQKGFTQHNSAAKGGRFYKGLRVKIEEVGVTSPNPLKQIN